MSKAVVVYYIPGTDKTLIQQYQVYRLSTAAAAVVVFIVLVQTTSAFSLIYRYIISTAVPGTRYTAVFLR